MRCLKTIDRYQVEKLFTPEVYQRGLRYYNTDRVGELQYDWHHDLWFGQVRGTEDYFVQVDFSKIEQGKIFPHCDCPAFATYGTCKHLAAVLLTVANEIPPTQGTFQMTSNFLDELTKQPLEEFNVLSDKSPLQVEYILKIDYMSQVWLEWKTGVGHRYVVQNTREFLDHVLDGEAHTFTKKFTYSPEEHYFLEQDLEIFKLLASFIATGDAFTDNGFYSSKSYDKRSLLIPPIGFKQLITLLQDRKVLLEVGNQTYESFNVEEKTLPYQFSLDQEDEGKFLLKIAGQQKAQFLRDYQAIFKEGTFYFPEREQLSMVEKIQLRGKQDMTLPITGDNTDRFFSDALPVLKQRAEVHIASEVSEGIEEFPLQATMHLEERDGLIIGNLMYHYGPHALNPFRGEERDSSVILVRETKKEEQIMHLIEESDFHYNGKELYIDLQDDEEVYDFLYTILPNLDQYVDLYLTSDIQRLMVEAEPEPTTNVSMENDANLLEIGFDISGVNDDEVSALLQAVVEKKRFYRLNSGALVSLEGEGFQKVEELLSDLNVGSQEVTDGNIKVPVYRGLHVDELVDKKKYDPAFQKLLHSLKHPEEQVYPLPERLDADLRNYQETGYQWFKSLSHYHLGGILADDMGLGKTLQTIAYLLSEPSEDPHLVIVPSSVIYNWRNEIDRFAPDLDIAVISGTPNERKTLINEATEKDIWITSYGTMRQDAALYEGLHFQTMVLDEAQFIKNYQTKTSKAVRTIDASRRFALSGTPIENSVDELWAIFQVILPGLLPALKEFRQLEPKRIAALTKPFIMRRLKTEVLTELPEKIESVHTSELTKDQKELYVGYLRELQTMASESIATNNFQGSRMKILAGLTRLRQLCCHPSLFIENYEGRSGKLDELLEQVQTMLNSGRRLLIFSQFTSMHDLVQQELEKLGIDSFYLQGSTPSKERVEMSEAFNNGEKDVFLISLKAGGTGLNLTGADTVILLDLWWNPAVEDQAAGRAHRFGQKNVVQVIRFITEGTIEEKIYELQQKKRELINQVIQPGETMLSSLSEDDIKELLSL